jgi:hypothetical protein
LFSASTYYSRIKRVPGGDDPDDIGPVSVDINIPRFSIGEFFA